MRVIFREMCDMKDITLHDFSVLSKTCNLEKFRKVRRLYRNKIVEQILDYEEFEFDYDLMEIHTRMLKKKFSCSYCGFSIAVGISDYKIGIDIEAYSKISPKKFNIFSSGYEREIFRSLHKHHSLKEVETFIWSCKESLGKLFDVGLSKGFMSFRFFKKDMFFVRTNFKSINRNNEVFIYYKFFDNICFVLSSFHNLDGSC